MSRQTAEIDIQLSNGQEAGKTINELTKQSVQLAREIKKLEIGSEEFVQKTKEYQQIEGRLKSVKAEVFSTAKAQEHLNSVFGDMIPFRGEFAKLSTGMKGVAASLKNASSMAQLFKVALASTGIGLLIVALGSLVAWLRKTQAGMDFVGKVTAAAGAAFQIIIDRAISFASALGNIMKGDFAAGINDLKATFTGLGDELVRETKAAYEMEEAMQDIVRAEKQLELQRSRSRAEIERLKMAAEDQTKTDRERLSAAQEAFNLENKLLNDSIALQERKLKIIREQNAMGTSTDEDLNREYDAEIELNNLREESFTKQTELQNKINELKRKGAAENIQLAQDEFTVVSENLDKELDLLNKKIAKELEAEAKAEEQKKKLREEALAARMEQLDTAFETEQLKLDQLFFEGQITEEERRQQAYEREKAFLQQRLTEMALLGETEVLQYQNLYTRLAELQYQHESEKTKVAQENEARRTEIMQQGLAAASGVFAGLATLLTQNAQARKKNFVVLKAVQAAEVAANTTTEISNIFKGYSALGPFGQALAIVQAAIAAARGAAAINAINNTQIQGGESFAEGGPVFGPSHKAGGIPFTVRGSRSRYEMEGNEIIMSKGVYENPLLRSIASELNYMGGGRKFALGGPVTDRPIARTASTEANNTIRNTISQNTAGATDMRMTNELLERIEANTRISAQKPVLSLRQIKDELTDLGQLEMEARF